MTKHYTIEELREKNLIIFEAVSGSHAYGTYTPDSDVDIRGVFVQPLSDALKYGWVEQVADKQNDVVFYELGRFVKLLMDNNPNILELIAMPEDCVKFKHPLFEELFEKNANRFLTKRVRWTFAGYAIQQIKKARGYNKKMNWEENEMVRKSVLDFSYVLDGSDSIPFKKWLNNRVSQKCYGLAKMNNARDVYALYYLKEPNYGIVSDEKTANDVQLTSIPKGLIPVAYLTFNKDGYSSHCTKYAEYQTWLKNRNVNRFKMNKAHGKNYDSKNMMHTYRLLLMAHELAEGKLIVRRSPEEIEKLMKIRQGEYEYDALLTEAESMINTLDEVFDKSHLPDKINSEFVFNTLYGMRKIFYNL